MRYRSSGLRATARGMAWWGTLLSAVGVLVGVGLVGAWFGKLPERMAREDLPDLSGRRAPSSLPVRVVAASSTTTEPTTVTPHAAAEPETIPTLADFASDLDSQRMALRVAATSAYSAAVKLARDAKSIQKQAGVFAETAKAARDFSQRMEDAASNAAERLVETGVSKSEAKAMGEQFAVRYRAETRKKAAAEVAAFCDAAAELFNLAAANISNVSVDHRAQYSSRDAGLDSKLQPSRERMQVAMVKRTDVLGSLSTR